MTEPSNWDIAGEMFRVTPVPEASKERKVSFSPDIDESYRHEVVGKIKNLMEEVSVSFFYFIIIPSLGFYFPSFFIYWNFPANTRTAGTTKPGPRYKVKHLLD